MLKSVISETDRPKWPQLYFCGPNVEVGAWEEYCVVSQHGKQLVSLGEMARTSRNLKEESLQTGFRNPEEQLLV